MAEAEGWGRDWLKRGLKELFGVMKMFYILTVVLVTWLYDFDKAHPQLTWKCVSFTVYKLDL